MVSPSVVLVTLKIAVAAVTVLLIVSTIAVSRGNKRLHGRINKCYFILTMTTVVGFEIIIRWVNPNLTDGFSPAEKQALWIHLGFSIPSALLMVVMLWTSHTRRKIHARLGILFWILWLGTFITGVFFLPN